MSPEKKQVLANSIGRKTVTEIIDGAMGVADPTVRLGTVKNIIESLEEDPSLLGDRMTEIMLGVLNAATPELEKQVEEHVGVKEMLIEELERRISPPATTMNSFVALMQGKRYIDANQLDHGIYETLLPALYSPDTTIETIAAMIQKHRDLGNLRIPDAYFENLQKCKLVPIRLIVE